MAPAKLVKSDVSTVPKKGSSSITSIFLTLRSTDPMLQHAMTDAARDNLPGGSKTIDKPNEDKMTPRERADLVRYRGPNGELGVPAKCLFSSFREAGKKVKIGAMEKITNAKQSQLPGFIRFKCEGGSMRGFLPFKDQRPESWEVDIDTTRNPTTGGRTCTIRPLFPTWEIELELEYNPALGIGISKFRELVDIAGAAYGLGANRLNNQYGRFEVMKWETKEKKAVVSQAA